MTDLRRLSTAAVLASGVLSRPAPGLSLLPSGREECVVKWKWEYIGDEAVLEALRAGKLVEAYNYYGIPHIWKEENRWRGVLLQYRATTDDQTFDDEAKALAWFQAKCSETAG